MTPYQFGKRAGINLASLVQVLRGVTRAADAASSAKPAVAAAGSPTPAVPQEAASVARKAVDTKLR